MSNIVDKRQDSKGNSVTNRQRFIRRYKKHIQKSIEDLSADKGITDILKDRKVVISDDSIDEPSYNYDFNKGTRDIIFPGNKKYKKGDIIFRPKSSKGGSGSKGGQGDGEMMDEFTFVLTKEEFLNLYFNDLCLPNFLKEKLNQIIKHVWKRAGYIKEGIPARLDLLKTLKQSLARRIATKSDKYLLDIDLRYRHFTKQPIPIKSAHMFCLMDVSGSMGEFEKTIAKKFFLLLYLFLHTEYKYVELTFIRHTEEAKEVTEHEFFHDRESGGTIVSSGLQLVNKIIDERIDLASTNVYVAQASDGDNWEDDDKDCLVELEKILTKVQYFAYVQTEHYDRYMGKRKAGIRDLFMSYLPFSKKHQHFSIKHIFNLGSIWTVFKEMFKNKDVK